MSQREDLRERVLSWAEARHLDTEHIQRWLALDAASAAAILHAASSLGLRTGQAQAALEMLEEIALREGTDAASILARAPFKRILEGAGSAPARARAFVNELRVMRFPRLGRALEELKAEVAALKLPRTVRMVLPKDLGSDELRIELRVRDGEELRASVRTLESRIAAIERILALIGGPV
jgi:hypothetical protein